MRFLPLLVRCGYVDVWIDGGWAKEPPAGGRVLSNLNESRWHGCLHSPDNVLSPSKPTLGRGSPLSVRPRRRSK